MRTGFTHKGPRLSMVVAVVAVLVLIAAPLRLTDVRAATEAPLDIAAMTLRPEDTLDAGYADHGISMSILADRPRSAAQFIEGWGWDSSVDDGRAFREANPERIYVMHLANDVEQAGFVYSPNLVASVVMEFDGTSAARDGLDAVVATWSQGEDFAEASTTLELGDEARVFAGTGVNPFDGVAFERMSLVLRVDSIVAIVSVHAYDADTPEIDQLEALGELQVERIDDVIDGEAPDMSNQIVRLRLDGEYTNWDNYIVHDDETLPLSPAYESDDAYRERSGEFHDLGVLDAYHLEQIVHGTPYGPAGELMGFMATTIYRFEDDEQATVFLDTFVESRLAENGGEEVSVPTMGDQARALTWTASDTGRASYREYVRVGSVVFRTTHTVDEGLDLVPAAVSDMAELQLACLEGESACESPVRVPEGIGE